MAFLDNSGDIILDAVLTDTGRYRLAKGDGSFRVVKFALGDDEINYRLYDKNNSSGSAYYDLSILQTPVLEAFTDNAASLKSKLITISRNNLLFLPVLKLNEIFSQDLSRYSNGAFLVAADKDTEDVFLSSGQVTKGVIKGETGRGGSKIRVDQGLDTTEISPAVAIDSDLVETQYIIEMDNRLGKVAGKNGNLARVSYVDDDNMASYFFSLGSDTEYVSENTVTESNSSGQIISGPRGTIFEFTLRSSLDLNTSTFLFDQLGDTVNITVDSGTKTFQYIDSNVRVMGATTGYKVDIPVRFVKLQ
jgi:hypothetical protein